MDLHLTGDWIAVVNHLEAGGRAPSQFAVLPEIWNLATPDQETAQRLADLELRFGSPVLAMDLACWALEALEDRPEIRVLAARAACRGGLPATARRLLRPLAEGLADCDHGQRRSVADAWRDIALATGGAADLKQAALLEPSDSKVLTRMADQLWQDRDHPAAISVYRWAIFSGRPFAKMFLRVTSLVHGGPGLPESINMLEAAYRRSGDMQFKARLLVLLLQADRRQDALALLDGGETVAAGDDATVARDTLVGYARAQLLAADAEAMDPSPAAAGDRWSARQRMHQRAGRALAQAGWHGPAVWQLRKAAGDPNAR